ncbi:MAG TPA: GNAT family N-acetyltransferase [Rhizomicrobium sp.]
MIETERLILRPWTQADVAEFARVTNTPAVRKHLGGVQTQAEIQAGFDRVGACQAKNGFSFWIVERRSDGALLGFCGLKVGTEASIAGEIEIGWRLREDAWGQGYAREAAQASLAWAWENLSCNRVVAVTIKENTPSWGLMERLGMRRTPELDFEHPEFPADNPVRYHIAYVIARPNKAASPPAD